MTSRAWWNSNSTQSFSRLHSEKNSWKIPLFSFSLFLSTFKYSQIFLVLIYIREAEYMRMVDQFHNGDLSFHFHQHGFRQFFSINDLDRHLLAQHTVDPKLDQSWNKHGDQFDWLFFYRYNYSIYMVLH